MSCSYLLVPLKEKILNFSSFSESNIDESKFNYDRVIEILKSYYPGIEFRDEGDGTFFSHYSMPEGNVEIWVFSKKSCMNISDALDNIMEISAALRFYVFDIDNNQDCLN